MELKVNYPTEQDSSNRLDDYYRVCDAYALELLTFAHFSATSELEAQLGDTAKVIGTLLAFKASWVNYTMQGAEPSVLTKLEDGLSTEAAQLLELTRKQFGLIFPGITGNAIELFLTFFNATGVKDAKKFMQQQQEKLQAAIEKSPVDKAM